MSRIETIGNATLYLGDSLQVLQSLAAGTADAVITDPPYFSGGAFHFWSALWAAEALRVSKSGAPAMFFTDWRHLPVSTDYLQAGGWVWRGLVPWAKKTSRPQMGRFNAQCEYVVWGSAGPMPVDRGVGCLQGFYEFSSPQDREHITQKPVELMAAMVEICAPGGTVLDPFMGSGTTGVAAVQLGRKFIGCEQNPEYFDIACRRIQEAVDGDRMFAQAAPVQLGLDAA